MRKIFEIVSASFGIVGGVVGLYGATGEAQMLGLWAALLISSCLLLYFIYPALKRRRASILGSLDFPVYQIRYATREDLKEISVLQRHFYSEDAVPLARYKEWYDANPDGFFVIEMTSPKKELIGHFTLLAIKNDRMEAYKAGKIRETDILACDLFTPALKSKVKQIYVESLIIKKEHRRHAIPSMIRILKTAISSFCDPQAVQSIYAVAATNDGAKTLNAMRFNTVDTDHKRLDGHEMYRANFTEFMEALGQHELNCEMRLLNRPIHTAD